MNPEERQRFIDDVAGAIRAQAPVLSDDELRWVRMAIEAEAQSAQFRKAVIEKSITSLVWSGIVAVGWMVLSWATAHGYKP